MRRFLLRWWAESCLVVPLLTGGCQYFRPCHASCEAPSAVTMGAPIAAPAGAAGVMEVPASGNAPVMPGASMSPANGPEFPAASSMLPATGTPAPGVGPASMTPGAPVLHTAAKPAFPQAIDPMLAQAPPPYPSAGAPDRHQALTLEIPNNSGNGANAADAAAASFPRFGHDPNYRWLVGPVDYCRIQQAWLLRYVPVEKEDRYGGCVTLVAPNQSINFKPGQIVRVEGGLIDPDSQQLRPAYEVQKIRAE